MEIDKIVYSNRPEGELLPEESAIYDKLEELKIPYQRVSHEHADTMEDCLLIEKVIGARICKNLFLTNRQETEFYLLMMPGDKPFKTKYITEPLSCSRLSFAGAEHMNEFLKTIPGSVSALELLFDTDSRVRLVIDKDLLKDEFICGHPGRSRATVKFTRDDLLKYVKAVGHEPTIIDLPDPRDFEE